MTADNAKAVIMRLNAAMFAAADAARLMEEKRVSDPERAKTIKRRVVRLRNEIIREYQL